MRVVQLGDPILRMKASRLIEADICSVATMNIVQRMKSVMQGIKQISPRNGNGLSAPQVGDPSRLIVLFFEDDFNVIINPEIIERSPDLFESPEGCLSFFYLRAPVLRNESIRVKYVNEQNQEIDKEFQITSTIVIYVDADDIRDPYVLREMDRISTKINKYNLDKGEKDGIVSVQSIASLIKDENAKPYSVSGLGGTGKFEIPDDRNLISKYIARDLVQATEGLLFIDNYKLYS